MRYDCPYCSAPYDVEQEHNGKRFQCVSCQKSFTIKFISPESENQSLQIAMRECPMCFGRIPNNAFKCMYCGEILKTKSGKPPVDRVGYIILGLTLGIIGIHCVYAKRFFDFLIHIVVTFIATPIIAGILAKCCDLRDDDAVNVLIFVFGINALWTFLEVAKDPNR